MTLGCTAAMSACGGGGGGGPSTATDAAPSSTQAKSHTPIIIDAQGDSTMYTVCEKPDSTYVQCDPTVPQLLQAALGPGVTVQNNAISGSTLAWRMYGTGSYTVPYNTYIHTDPAQIVLMNWNINDARSDIGDPVTTYQQFLVDFVTLTRAVGKIPVLEEPNPTSFPQALTPYVQAMDYVATQMNVPLVKQFDYIQSLPNWRSMLQADGIHPGLEMYQMKAQREAQILEPIVQAITQ